jgi:hypothetical protein
MGSAFSIILAAKLVGSVLTVADDFPKFNPEPSCRAATAINQSIDLAVSQDFKACMADEDSAKEELQKSWSKYSAADKRTSAACRAT